MTNELQILNKTNLPVSYEDFNTNGSNALDSVAGVEEDYGSFLPVLRINYAAEWVAEGDKTSEPIPLPRGHFKITFTTEEGTPVTAYAKNVTLHPYVRRYRFTAWDKKEQKSALNSTLFTDWGDAIVDDNGQEHTGKTYKRNTLRDMPKYDQEGSVPLRCNVVLYGTVTFHNAKDMHGVPVTVVDQPCVMYAKGASFMPVSEALTAINKSNKKFYNYGMQLSTTREQNGDVVYFPLSVAWTDTAIITNQEVYTKFIKLIEEFLKTIQAENMHIIKKYEDKKSKYNSPSFTEDFGGQSLSSDFNDPLPEAMGV